MFNELVKKGRVKAPIVIGRDHLDSGSVASPNRETEANDHPFGFRLVDRTLGRDEARFGRQFAPTRRLAASGDSPAGGAERR